MTQTANIMPVYQSIKAAVKVTGLSEYFLRANIKAGKVAHIKSGAKILINVPRLLLDLESGGADYAPSRIGE